MLYLVYAAATNLQLVDDTDDINVDNISVSGGH